MLNTDSLLSNTRQGLDVFEFYLPGISRKIGKAILSPFRDEKSPSFNIFLDDKSNEYRFKDFGIDKSGNAFEFVKLMEGLDDFKDVLMFVNDQILGSGRESQKAFLKSRGLTKPIEKPKNDVKYSIEYKEHIDLTFWEDYGISQIILQLYKVKQVEKYIKTENGISKPRSFTNYLCFAYHVDQGVKLYMPKLKPKFLHCNKASKPYVFGYDQLPETGNRVFLTGGEKDVLTLRTFGESAICFNSETCHVDAELIEELKVRFLSIIVLYDNDETGEKAANKICKEHDLIYANIGKDRSGKDISDYKKDGLNVNQFTQLIEKQIEAAYKVILSKLEPFRFNIDKEVSRPTPIIRHGNNSILSVGNLLAVLGKVKTGKSAYIYEILTRAFFAILGNQENIAFGYTVEPIDEKSIILHFETEQSEYDWHKRLKNIIKGQPNLDRFISYSLTKFAPKERLGMILQVAYYYLTKGLNIHLLAIDGIADLVDSVNDEAECNTLIHKLHSLATTYKIPILVVLHLNPDGSKSRGHLGSQLDRKAESVLVVEREKDAPSSCIKARYTRNADMYQMPVEMFHWDEMLKKHVYSGEMGEEQRVKKNAEMLHDFVLCTFSADKVVMPKTEFMDAIAMHFKVQKSRAYDYLKELRALGYVIEDKKQISIAEVLEGQL